ncbi:hypothetical protein [Chromohalobacter israelensis]|uniref:hypothetical protein n=1 Tax=Chromohalobacter israelensis TaxID=141390 RepID=UPI0015C40FAA|nr:hypothetical protein [Chromohalobacter salexigens]NWO56680.1 hypothetical protein [Chromohalobacter salexigens]
MTVTLLTTAPPRHRAMPPSAGIADTLTTSASSFAPAASQPARGKRERCEIGSLAHLRHDIVDTLDTTALANARRRSIFYSRWYGLADPLLQIWRG